MHQKMCPICIWLPEAHWSFTKCCRLTSGLEVEARSAAGLFDRPTESSMIATWSGGAWHALRNIGMHFSLT